MTESAPQQVIPLQQPELVRPPDPIDLAEARLDTDYMNAMQSAEWHTQLANPGRLRSMGRAMLNATGVETSAQKALQYHEGIMGNYAESAGLSVSEVAAVTPDQHADLRLAAVERGLEDGSVADRRIDTSLTVNIRPIEPPHSLGLRNHFVESKKRRSLPNAGMPNGVRALGFRASRTNKKAA